jgi:hypothetical protein
MFNTNRQQKVKVTYMTAYSRSNRPFTAAEMEEPFKEAVNSVATVAVESGATSFNEGRGGNCKPASPISLHAVP